jgi:hypothetical protein
MARRSLVEVYRRFRGTYCLLHQDDEYLLHVNKGRHIPKAVIIYSCLTTTFILLKFVNNNGRIIFTCVSAFESNTGNAWSETLLTQSRGGIQTFTSSHSQIDNRHPVRKVNWLQTTLTSSSFAYVPRSCCDATASHNYLTLLRREYSYTEN